MCAWDGDVWVCCLKMFYRLNTSIIIREPFCSDIVRKNLMTFSSHYPPVVRSGCKFIHIKLKCSYFSLSNCNCKNTIATYSRSHFLLFVLFLGGGVLLKIWIKSLDQYCDFSIKLSSGSIRKTEDKQRICFFLLRKLWLGKYQWRQKYNEI